MALSRIDTTNMIEDVPQSKLDNNINFRNIIINGDMSIAQRGTSVTGVGNGDSGYLTVDRFNFFEGGDNSSEFTMSQSTDVPTGQGFATSVKFDCTTADASPGSGDNYRFRQLIEGQNLQYLKKGTSSAESTTLSFWVKSNKTGTYICELYDLVNNRQISKSYTISSASTWEKKTLTFAGDTTGTLTNNNTSCFGVHFYLLAGSDYTSGTLSTTWTASTTANRAVGQVNLADSTSNEWYITGVQLEAGTTASDFEFLPHDVNATRCERYYQDLGEIYQNGAFWTNAEILYGKSISPVMRANPTGTGTTTSGTIGSISVKKRHIRYMTVNSHTTAGGYNVTLKLDAEL